MGLDHLVKSAMYDPSGATVDEPVPVQTDVTSNHKSNKSATVPCQFDDAFEDYIWEHRATYGDSNRSELEHCGQFSDAEYDVSPSVGRFTSVVAYSNFDVDDDESDSEIENADKNRSVVGEQRSGQFDNVVDDISRTLSVGELHRVLAIAANSPRRERTCLGSLCPSTLELQDVTSGGPYQQATRNRQKAVSGKVGSSIPLEIEFQATAATFPSQSEYMMNTGFPTGARKGGDGNLALESTTNGRRCSMQGERVRQQLLLHQVKTIPPVEVSIGEQSTWSSNASNLDESLASDSRSFSLEPAALEQPSGFTNEPRERDNGDGTVNLYL